ncbi:hypothetical protein RJ640_008609 [Escallonia rubra]|uniref:Uncharacterized protein n=1 Tax=Escallonia rubra TaxID=112253 RepID=A0AA88R6I4_9ASTE|nr:hypothetical protein RJ640_008609 [Escallonia rubra]
MEATAEAAAAGLLEKIRPPRLEDAGLEDCALPPESIREAFLKAATAVNSTIFSPSEDDDEEPQGKCVNDPWPTLEDPSDALLCITPEGEPQGSCAVEKGRVPEDIGDEVAVGGEEAAAEDKLLGPGDLPEGGESCVDGLQGLEIGGKGNKLKNGEGESESEEEDEEGGERPILAETYV